MKDFNSIEDILNFAIDLEQGAVDFYNNLAENSKNAEMKEVFSQFAREEMGHKARLTKIKEEGIFDVASEIVADLHISDYVISVEVTPNMSYQDALVLAMEREKNAYKLYTKLSAKAPNEDLKKIFSNLAQDEAKHKLRFELEYDEFVLREN